MFNGQEFSRPSHPGLDFVDDIDDPVFFGERFEPPMELERRQDIASLPLDGLDEDSRDLAGAHQGLANHFLDGLGAMDAAGIIGQVVRTAIAIPVGDMMDSGKEGGEVKPLFGLAGRQAQGAHGPAMEGTEEGDDVGTLGVIANQLDGGLDGLGARIRKKDTPLSFHRHHPRQSLGQVRERLVVKIGRADVEEFLGLPLDRLDHLGMAVSSGVDRDARHEIEEAVAVHVLDHRPLPSGDDQRIFLYIGAGCVAPVLGDDFTGPFPGQRGFDVRDLCGHVPTFLIVFSKSWTCPAPR